MPPLSVQISGQRVWHKGPIKAWVLAYIVLAAASLCHGHGEERASLRRITQAASVQADGEHLLDINTLIFKTLIFRPAPEVSQSI